MGATRISECNPLTIMIVDTEDQARSALKEQLSRLRSVNVAAEASSIRSAISKLKLVKASGGDSINAIFLDVNMPDASGITFAKALQRLPSPPAIVFVSTHSEYALDAFDLQAVDFLAKPVQFERLALSIARVQEQLKLRALARKLEKIPVSIGGKKTLLHIDDIRFAEAFNDYSYLQTDCERYFAIRNLTQLERSLTDYGFFRVHRSYLVNLDQVEAVEPCKGGGMLLTLSGIRDKVPVSRRRAPQVKNSLGI